MNQKKSKPPEKASDIRAASILALFQVFQERETTDVVIRKFSSKYGLDSRDKSLFAEIVFGVLKNVLFIDYILLKLLSEGRFPSFISANALRVGAYQIAFTNIPVYAAVDSTVEALRSLDAKDNELALTNAVLRNFYRKWKDFKLPDDIVANFSIKYSHPEWIVKRWLDRYSREMAEKILSANNAAPPRAFRINTSQISPIDFKAKLADEQILYQETPFPEFIILKEKIAAPDFEPFTAGLLNVQDAAFAIPTRILSPNPDDRILEIGAAPGGKTSHIIEFLQTQTENFFTIDLKHTRNLKISDNLIRLKHSLPGIVTADATNPPFKQNRFDKILIDAPCSSWGVIRRHPEIRWRRKPEDEKRLSDIQRKLIRAAYNLLKPDGELVFTTCTTEPEENQGAVREIILLGMELIPIPDSIPQKFIEAQGFVARTWQHRDNMDGSFNVAARKRVQS